MGLENVAFNDILYYKKLIKIRFLAQTYFLCFLLITNRVRSASQNLLVLINRVINVLASDKSFLCLCCHKTSTVISWCTCMNQGKAAGQILSLYVWSCISLLQIKYQLNILI